MTETLSVALYARISEDMTGEAAGVERQLRDERALADAHGWRVVGEYVDNDLSALTGKARPGYEELRARVQAGGIDRILVWQTSRLWRNRGERARDIDAFWKLRVGVIAVKGPDLDLSNAYGRGLAGLLGEFDTMESEIKGERVTAAAADRARSGRPNGALGYGWQVANPDEPRANRRTWVEHREQAAIVREVTDRLLRGETLRAVTDELNRRGVEPPGAGLRFTKKTRAHNNGDGTRWNKTSVKKLALRASNAGVRVHHKGKPDEQLYPGTWPALVTRERWEALRAMLEGPDRAITRPGSRQHLLTWGIGYCAVCGSVLRTAMKGNAKHGTKARLYICDAKGCVGRNEAAVDELVRDVVIRRLAEPDALDWLAGDDARAAEAQKRVRELTARLDEAADRYADGKITGDQMERITERLRPQIEDAESERLRHRGAQNLATLAELAKPGAELVWDGMSVAERRAVLAQLHAHVTINRASRRGPGFNDNDVRVEFKSRAAG